MTDNLIVIDNGSVYFSDGPTISVSARKVIIQTQDDQIIHLEGFNLDQAEKALELSKSMSVIQTEPDETK